MKKHRKFEKVKLKKGIFILPNIFTSLNILCGFYAVIASINGDFVSAAVSILIAAVFDTMDGKVARATHTTSRFGVEYDSLADVISFGMAPGITMYLWALQSLGRIGWLAAFLFAICGALRLARFNTQVGSISSEYFVGLPIPGGAGMAAITILFFNRLGIEGRSFPMLILIELYVLSFLMISTIRYYSFKKPELFHRMKFNVLVTAVLILIFVVSQPQVALFVTILAYILSGPFSNMKYRQSLKEQEIVNNEHNVTPV